MKVYADHKNLMQKALGYTSDRVYHWRLLLEEFGPDIVWIKGAYNTVADAISYLDYAPVKEHNHHWMMFTQRWNFYTYMTPADHPVYKDSLNFVFAIHRRRKAFTLFV